MRSVLSMAALVGVRYNAVRRGFYESLLSRGKSKKVAGSSWREASVTGAPA